MVENKQNPARVAGGSREKLSNGKFLIQKVGILVIGGGSPGARRPMRLRMPGGGGALGDKAGGAFRRPPAGSLMERVGSHSLKACRRGSAAGLSAQKETPAADAGQMTGVKGMELYEIRHWKPSVLLRVPTCQFRPQYSGFTGKET